MTIRIVEGCLLDAFDKGEVYTIGHCVNCKGIMGSGIAKSIRDKYPAVYDEYINFGTGRDVLGCAQEVELEYGSIFNLFGQEGYGRGTRQVNYGAIANALQTMASVFSPRAVIGFPYNMCSDRAGGDFNIILEMIDFYFQNNDVRIYKL